jgi:AraC-like DNA-binding protein/mannose-6-phosphate isomerase-like protein (cupin superfamily)
MKPYLEKIHPEFGSSFSIKRFTQEQSGGKPFWHFHPEYEIVYVSHGKGKRHIANHISYFEEGDLIMLGPNLPHMSFSEELSESHTEIVVQMQPDFLGQVFWSLPEMAEIRALFERADNGLVFYGETKAAAGRHLHAMMDMGPLDRLLALLALLQDLARSTGCQSLQVKGFVLPVDAQHYERVERVFEYVTDQFQRAITLEAAAAQANLTVPAFCRFFKKLTGKTFVQFVNEIRISHACSLLANGEMGIAAISYESGFNNLSHFNKQFREITGISPRDYRSRIIRVVREPD